MPLAAEASGAALALDNVAALMRGRLADPEVGAVAAALGIATFRWDARSDQIAWSDNAADVLGLADEDVPATGRLLQRLLTAETAPVRAASVPPVGVAAAAGSQPANYRVVYRLRPHDRGTAPRLYEEFGRWIAGGDGCAISSEGCIRVLHQDPDLPASPGDAVNATTGLLLRDSLLARLDATVKELSRDRQGSAAFLVIAVDDLARLNANFGYEIGDRVIETVAQRIGRRMRQGDVLGHISGHKFGAILHNCSETSLAFAADRFRAAVSSELIVTIDTEIQARVSIGAVVIPRHATDAETAAIRAEEALADARSDGEPGFRIYHPSPERDLARRRNLECAEDIVRGLADERFILAYQPVVDARTRTVVSYEALTRLIRADGTVVSAGPLIATAERLGLVRRIDLQALKLALHDLDANPGLRLSVNVSVETVTDPVWLGMLVDAVSANRSIAQRLTIEITETAAMRNVEEMIRMYEILRDIGCRVAIDDFGSGHTSFKALRDMEVDWVKIDGSYVRDITSNPDSAIFVKTLAGLADHFCIHTVAEWVQDEAAAAMLRDMGIHALQGRFVGEPRLRVTDLTRRVVEAAVAVKPSFETDGYATFRGVLEGPLAVGGPVETG
jgi:diguanylate cyclase (GGDEF)-like protein